MTIMSLTGEAEEVTKEKDDSSKEKEPLLWSGDVLRLTQVKCREGVDAQQLTVFLMPNKRVVATDEFYFYSLYDCSFPSLLKSVSLSHSR